ncbi:MAG: hypothetical protein ABR524_11360 [Thermoanaerobaculia bacterium]
MKPRWRFREMSRGEVNVDPVHDEFFKAQDLADALVRESVQNSLDARRGRSTVRVRFRFRTGADALPPETAEAWLGELFPHLRVVDGALSVSTPLPGEPMPLLLVEDFGTRGLSGDPTTHPDLDDHAGPRNDFHFFWRNVGRSMKGELDRGRWGLGKAVFTVASRVRSIFGLTLRQEDGRRLLMGQSVLRIHSVGSERFAPYGFFGLFDRELFPMPVEDEKFIQQFESEAGSGRDEAGLSVVIPWPRLEELPFERLVASAIDQYFYPIARGDLVVQVVDGSREETLSSKTLEDSARRLSTETATGSKAKLCDLARWAAVVPDSEIIRLEEPDADAAPRWSASAESSLAPHRERFDRGDRLAFEVPLFAKKRGRRSATHFRVFLEKDDALKKGEHHFIRRGITIPGIRTPQRDKPVRGLVVIDDEPLATLLGDAENPAHSDWSERADKIRLLYEHGPFTVRYVRGALPHLVSLLSRTPEGPVRDLLEEVFSLDLEPEENARPAGAPGAAAAEEGEAAAGGAHPGGSSTSHQLSIVRLRDGFRIRRKRTDGPLLVTGSVAYRVRSGNAFRRWDPRDFRLERPPIVIAAEGAGIRSVEGNAFELDMNEEGASIELTGFDPHRDLVIRIDTESDHASETELH